ncbi:MAG TPA: alpha/beta hydrolase [Steroidobacteraceae bacterium]|nr:alpha/beta hydrolase [Steroidobacteraceae bacterium]
MKRLLLLAVMLLPLAAPAAPPPVERNVVYGMYSGLALLLDVHRPANPNGYGIVFISGSGWQADSGYGAGPLKNNQIDLWGPPLTAAGYTVFAINHRGAPRFHFPAALEDTQRAIRFVRAHAKEYGIDGARLGGLGGSSGGNLIGLAAMLAAPGDSGDADIVNRESSALQAIVLRAAVSDLRTVTAPAGVGYVVQYMETAFGEATAIKALYASASPIEQVSPRSPPALLIHGDADKLIPYQQSVAMEGALRAAKVPSRLITIPGGEHGANFVTTGEPRPDWPDYFGATVAWFDQYLRGRP